MPYSYDPEAAGLIPEGVHQLIVASIEETTSRKGDPMWIVRLEDAQRREVTEWVVQTPNIIEWKFRPLWEAAGLTWPTSAAVIDEQDVVDRHVQATITHERSEKYGTSARIQGYVKPGTGDVPNGQEAFDTSDMQPAAAGGSRYGQEPDGDDEPIPF